MRNLKFHFVRAQNILCFGPKGVELKFDDYGKIIQLVGINLDMPGTKEIPGSNGSGKSSVSEILSIGLFGRTIKCPTQNKGMQIIHTLAEKGEVEVQWDDYRLIRTFKKKKTGGVEAKLQLWKSDLKVWDKNTEVDRLKNNIENEIQRMIGLSHHAFCNVVVFDDSSEYSFLEADTPTKRQIVENLLDLDQYREYHENSKKNFKDLKEQIVSLTRDYSNLLDYLESCQKRINDIKTKELNWTNSKNNQINSLLLRIEEKQNKLQQTDIGDQLNKWQSAQDSIIKIGDENVDLESKRNRLGEIISQSRSKLGSVHADKMEIKQFISDKNSAINSARLELNKVQKLISKLKDLEEGESCPYCLGTIHKLNHQHVIEQSQSEIDRLELQIENDIALLDAEQEKYNKKNSSLNLMEEKIKEADKKVIDLENKIKKNRDEIRRLSSIAKPESNASEKILESEIVELKSQIKNCKEELKNGSPYKEIIDNEEKEKSIKEIEKDNKIEQLKIAEEELPYYQFWVEAFGDNGIRKFVIDGIIPSLNERIAYWMEILCDGLIEITFDNSLKETMTRNGNRADYSNASNGEKRRINLAVSQAFAHVMMLSSGTCPSIVFLDEITGGGIDRAGINGVHNMIYELAKERQVFVTTHNETLGSLLNGCESITLKKQNDVTVID